jgi:hypothetical protein
VVFAADRLEQILLEVDRDPASFYEDLEREVLVER